MERWKVVFLNFPSFTEWTRDYSTNWPWYCAFLL